MLATFVVALPLLASGACGPTTPSSVPLGGVDEPKPKEERPHEERKAEAPVGEVPPDGGAGGAAHGVEDDGEPEIDEDDADEESEEAESEDVVEEAPREDGIEKPPAPPCDDSTPENLDCSALEPSCPLALLCTSTERIFKGAVAQALIDCSADEDCRPDAARECLKSAVGRACVDDAARRFCAERFEACRRELEAAEITRSFCERGLSALQPKVRERFEDCARDTCNPGECSRHLLPKP